MLLNDLKAYCPNAVPMHMPGHMRNVQAGGYLSDLKAEWDITEIDGFDDLHHPQGVLLDSMNAAADLWKSDHTRYLVNGSTCGILAAVYALAPLGGQAVCARNAHKSLYHALEITGVRPAFVSPRFDKEAGIVTDVSPDAVESALDSAPQAKFVFVTSPTYEGVISDIGKICTLAHKRGIPVIVDEAHGAHLGLSQSFPSGAVAAGADIVIQSVHKTLLSLTQTAVIHVSGKLVSLDAIDHALDIFETSSPSYLLMASIDGCVRLMRDAGRDILSTWRTHTDEFRKKAAELKNIRVWTPENAFCYDPSKIVLMHPGMTGTEVMEELRRGYSIETEAAYPAYCLAMTGAGTKKESIDRLYDALFEMDQKPFAPRKTAVCAPPGAYESVLSVRQALLEPFECVPLECAEGRISAEYAWAYPPGIPVFAPGEKIEAETLSVWKSLEESLSGIRKTRSGAGRIAVIKK